MKALKRDARRPATWRPDEGHPVTGAVGLLDRVGALSFAAPVFFHSVRWYSSGLVSDEHACVYSASTPACRPRASASWTSTGAQLHYVASGTIKTSGAAQGDLPARLKIIFDGVQEVVRRYEPTVASVEIVFVNVNPQSTLLLGQARGAALAGW